MRNSLPLLSRICPGLRLRLLFLVLLACVPLAGLTLHSASAARRRERARPATLEWDDVHVDPARRVATRGARELGLTNREFALLEELVAADGDVLSAETLMDRVWDDRVDPFSNIVRVTILTLRRKLGDPPIIETVVGAGYRMVHS